MIRLVLVRGLPGSGKSTLAKRHLDSFTRHFETDQFFMQDGTYKFDGSKLKEAHAWCLASTKRILDAGGRVVVSNTFTQLWEMQPYLDLVRPEEVLVIKATGEFRNEHGVPSESVQRMKARWEDFPRECVNDHNDRDGR